MKFDFLVARSEDTRKAKILPWLQTCQPIIIGHPEHHFKLVQFDFLRTQKITFYCEENVLLLLHRFFNAVPKSVEVPTEKCLRSGCFVIVLGYEFSLSC